MCVSRRPCFSPGACSPRQRCGHPNRAMSRASGPARSTTCATRHRPHIRGSARCTSGCPGRRVRRASWWRWYVSRRRERGVALLAAVAGLAVLGVLAVGLAHTSAVDQHLARNALARSGVAAAAVFLTERDPDAIDWPHAPWAQGSGRQPLGAGWLEVTVEDEARRLSLGTPDLADALPRLLRLLGLDDP